jgi:hypothetical protein
MRSRTRDEKRIIAALVVMTVAILGYIVGHDRAIAVPVESTLEASNAATIVHYSSDSGWRPASTAPTVPGLSIAQPLVLAPHGDATRGGLIVGQLLGGETSPLPSQLLAHLAQLPSTEVVDLANTQAYRYSPLSVAGSGEKLTLYTIPGSLTSTTAIVCYASAGFSVYMQACERLAAGLTIAGGTSNGGEVRAIHPLTPEAGYGRRIAAAVARADELLLTLRPELRRGSSRSTVSTLAGRLAEGFASVADSLSALHPPPAAGQVHAALSESLKQAQAAYSALGAAVGAGSASDYAVARAQISGAEAGLNGALKNFALLGYK